MRTEFYIIIVVLIAVYFTGFVVMRKNAMNEENKISVINNRLDSLINSKNNEEH